ncbi:MAG: RdgB/HAM1 family non-canonical purine NTP pyrophosphatase [Alphaproteobacteria bacterium]
MKLSKGLTIALATRNEGKILELKDLFASYGIKALSLKELNILEPEETGVSFEENALIKARHCAQHSKLPSVADDSGLCIRALGGQPGVFTARWAGPNKDYSHAMNKIYEEVISVESRPDKRASFVCYLALTFPDQENSLVFDGKVEGELSWPPKGTNNLGFDPIFKPIGYDKTFAEMSLSEKQLISHRSEAFKNLAKSVLSES